MSLLDLLSTNLHPFVADGSVEAALPDLDTTVNFFPPRLCLDQPESVSAAHGRYRDAGARILRTNSLGAHPIRLAKLGLDDHTNEINWQAAQLAKQAGRGLEIAGRVGPLGISAEEAAATGVDREEYFRLQIGALLDGGATMIWLEGFQDFEELVLAHAIKQSLHHCPAICSLHVSENQDHSALAHAIGALQDNDAEILGLDGTSTFVEEALTALKAALGSSFADSPWAVLVSAQPSRQEFVTAGRALAAAGAQILGGGLHTTPGDITALADAFSERSDS